MIEKESKISKYKRMMRRGGVELRSWKRKKKKYERQRKKHEKNK